MSSKREVVAAMVEHGVSERSACRAVGLQRSTYRYRSKTKELDQQSDGELREKIVTLAHKHNSPEKRRPTEFYSAY